MARVAKFFELRERLGKGAFGEVYSGVDTRTGARVAIKMEAIDAECPQLVYEARIMEELQHAKGIPRKYWFGLEGDNNILIMQRLGKCLVESYLTVDAAFDVANQILERLHTLHAAGFAYRDMKPDNFVYGTGVNRETLFIIDFGLCKRVVDPRTGTHIQHRSGKSLSGTPRYSSIRTHEGEEQSRRDDIEAFGYMLLYLVNGKLPWQGASSKDNYAAVAHLKRTIPLSELCADLPRAFAATIDYARRLGFSAMPDYAYLHSLWSAGAAK